MDYLKKAIALAKKMHKGQMRQTGEPYVNHCLRVMETTAQYTDDEEILSAAVLHDICEDTSISLPNLSELFSPRVSFLVNSLSKNQKYSHNKNYDPQYRMKLSVNRFAKGALSDPWVMLIKLADQIDNSATFHIFTEEKQNRKRQEITEIFFPIYKKVLEFHSSVEETYKKLEKELFINIA